MLKRLISAVVLVGLVALSVASPVPAATPTAGQDAGQGLEISPPLFDLKADPGQNLKAQIRLRNVTSQTVQTRAQYDDFVAGNEEGLTKLLLKASERSPYSIKDWLSSIPTLTLGPGEQKSIDLNIGVPQNAAPGGHYGVIRFTAAAPEVDQSAVSLSASVGSLVLVTVSGDVKVSANIAELATAQNGDKRGLFEYGPVEVITRVRNTGNVHIQPKGTIRITDTFGREVASFQLNDRRGNVLPSSIRRFENTLNKKLLFGRYEVQADVVYGDDQKIVSRTATFWAIPYKLITLAIAVIIGLIILIRSYNRYILRRANKKNHDQPQKTKKP